MSAEIIIIIAALVAVFFALTRKTPRPVLVSFYGDSITRGDGLNPRPVERRTELARGAFVGIDYSLGGATVQDATAGDYRLPYKMPFADWIKQDPAKVCVIGHAGANALHYPDRIDEYDALLTAMITQARDSGKAVVLSGMTWVAAPIANASEADSARILQNLSEFDDRTEWIAMREGCKFLDLRSVPFNGAMDMLDQVHPAQAYADRVSAYVVQQLINLISGEPS